MARRASVSDPWTEVENLGENVNSVFSDSGMGISPDGLTLYFGSKRPGGYGPQDLYVTTRASISEPWTEAVNLGPAVNSSGDSGFDAAPYVSFDGATLYFCSSRFGGGGAYDLWKVPISPVPACGDENHPYPTGDLNQDCNVDFSDLAILLNHWLECNDPNPYGYPDVCFQITDGGC